ncbi:metallophosphoesterase [Methylobacter sp. S3L5C]|uniref:DUF7910 domain-containing protein n=1 Tax=Methylobacter sp. S3L5C TaxID=2839024 RepID=UPI001FAE1147|nr:metallophosphoesterase [Methylobacter sp. S3L5C]UOA08855.1 metallophosphoesterase [Methylobacter sp. S3L5C]
MTTITSKDLEIVRPNMGSPLIIVPNGLLDFEITVAYFIPWEKPEKKELPSYQEVLALMKNDPPQIEWGGKRLTLNVLSVYGLFRHPKYTDDYANVKHAETSAQQQYHDGFRWEMRARVGLPQTSILELKAAFGWPSLLNLRWGKVKYHALYVHETLTTNNKFTILHITDTHIAQRNDKIPEILSTVRNIRECEDLSNRYVNFNDNLRALIKEANKRAKAGENVLVILTGDIIDHYHDGWIDGVFVCGQGNDPKDKRSEVFGSSWGYSNVSKFIEIILAKDQQGEALNCPLLVVPGNHDYLMNEVLLNMHFTAEGWMKLAADILGKTISINKNSASSFGLTDNEGREYDYFSFPGYDKRSKADRQTFKSNIQHNDWRATISNYWPYWLAKPKSWQFSQYLHQVSYDLEFNYHLGNHQLLLLNTGNDRYPRFEEFAGIESTPEWASDYIHNGPHSRGITTRHLEMTKEALDSASKEGLLLIFLHAPLMSLEKDETTGIEVLYEDNHAKAKKPTEQEKGNEVSHKLVELYGTDWKKLQAKGFPLFGTKYFKKGERDPCLNFSSSDGEVVKFLDSLCRVTGEPTGTPTLVFSGHTHKAHEFRIEKIDDVSTPNSKNFYYYTDTYCHKYFGKTSNGLALIFRLEWLKTNSPLLLTSAALKLGSRNRQGEWIGQPQYREIMVDGQAVVSLEMKDLPMVDFLSTAKMTPACWNIALRADNGMYVCAELGGGRELIVNRTMAKEWETFEMSLLESNFIALKSWNGQFVKAVGGGGGKVNADSASIGDQETFQLTRIGSNKIALRTKSKGKYVCAEAGGGRELVANRDQIGPWETFTLIPLDHLSTPKAVSGAIISTQPRRIKLIWKTVIGAANYNVEVQYQSADGKWHSAATKILPETEWVVDFLGAYPGQWRVSAQAEFALESEKSPWMAFKFTQ